MKTGLPAVRRRVLTRYSAEDRERLIRAQESSGLTILAFCEREGIKPWTFYGWREKRRAVARRPRLAQVDVAPCRTVAVEVLLTNGVRVGIRHAGEQQELVALVRGVAGCAAGRRPC